MRGHFRRFLWKCLFFAFIEKPFFVPVEKPFFAYDTAAVMNFSAIQIFGQKKTPLKREDARHLSAWHSYEKVIRKPAALATVYQLPAVFLPFSLWYEYRKEKWTDDEVQFKKH